MNYLVTGAAGFIGSHLCDRLLALGHRAFGVDAFIPYYPRAAKERNLAMARRHPGFVFHDADLCREPLEPLVADVDAVFHLAAMPGLTTRWNDLDGYWACNVVATQRLLEAVRTSNNRLTRFVLASTSSVYGRFASGDEDLPACPISPYGISKVAAEHLADAYRRLYELPVVTLRYFSVYGPRQRPDMGYFKFLRALLTGEPVTVYGDGQQVRGNTFVDDCVDATIRAVGAPPGEVFNVGGGEAVNVWEVLKKMEAISGRSFAIRQAPERRGDQRRTLADTGKIQRLLGWRPNTLLDEGLARQWRWQQTVH